MRRTIIIFCIIALSLMVVSCVYEGDKVVKIQELPNNELYEIDGHHVDLGISFKQDGIDVGIKLPYHNYGDPEYVLFYKSNFSDEYNWHSYSLDQEDIQFFVDLYGIPETPKLPLWDRIGVFIGGAIAAILVIVGVIWIIVSAVEKIRDWL